MRDENLRSSIFGGRHDREIRPRRSAQISPEGAFEPEQGQVALLSREHVMSRPRKADVIVPVDRGAELLPRYVGRLLDEADQPSAGSSSSATTPKITPSGPWQSV